MTYTDVYYCISSPRKNISDHRKVSLCYVRDFISNLNIKCIKCLGGSTVGETVDDRIKIKNDLNNLKKKLKKKRLLKDLCQVQYLDS